MSNLAGLGGGRGVAAVFYFLEVSAGTDCNDGGRVRYITGVLLYLL